MSEVSGILEEMSNKNNKISPRVAAIKIYPQGAGERRPPNKFEG